VVVVDTVVLVVEVELVVVGAVVEVVVEVVVVVGGFVVLVVVDVVVVVVGAVGTYSAYTDIGPAETVPGPTGSFGPLAYASTAKTFLPGVVPTKCSVA